MSFRFSLFYRRSPFYLFKSGITLQPILTFAMFCKTFFRTLTDNVTAYVRVQGVRVSLSLPTESNFTRGFLHALSISRSLHAVSITRRFQSWSLTRCFRYMPIPYPHKRLYTPFPLHVHSVYPKKWQRQK